jgi:hypothetical protein
VLVYFGTLQRCTVSSCINPDTFLFVMDSHVTNQPNQDLKRTYDICERTLILSSNIT